MIAPAAFRTALRIFPCEAGEVARAARRRGPLPSLDAPSTMLRIVPLPRFAGEDQT